MVTNGTAALAGKVLNEISRWTTTGGKQLRLAGDLAFLALSHSRGAPKLIAEERGDKQRATPTLLVLAERNANLRPMLAELWSRCLNASEMHQFAGGSLDAWATAVESDASSRAQFVDVLRRSAFDPRTNRILVRAAGRWSSGEGPLLLELRTPS